MADCVSHISATPVVGFKTWAWQITMMSNAMNYEIICQTSNTTIVCPDATIICKKILCYELAKNQYYLLWPFVPWILHSVFLNQRHLRWTCNGCIGALPLWCMTTNCTVLENSWQLKFVRKANLPNNVCGKPNRPERQIWQIMYALKHNFGKA